MHTHTHQTLQCAFCLCEKLFSPCKNITGTTIAHNLTAPKHIGIKNILQCFGARVQPFHCFVPCVCVFRLLFHISSTVNVSISKVYSTYFVHFGLVTCSLHLVPLPSVWIMAVARHSFSFSTKTTLSLTICVLY